MNILVVPSNRPDRLQAFLEVWDGEQSPWDEVMVVEDGPTLSAGINAKYHFCWEQIDDYLQDAKWIISRRDSAIRSFGFLMAWDLKADYIFTLDDDCLPNDVDAFARDHIHNLEHTPHWTTSVPGTRTRGLPWFEQGEMNSVKVSHGLWSLVPDLDAVQTLGTYGGVMPDFTPPAGTRVLPHGQYFPMCGMNLAFKREAAPLMYFPLMGDGVPYRRFDDIWCGILVKKVCDHLGWHITSGEPHVIHSRASDTMTNLVKEAPGIQRNETFWQDIDNCTLTASTAAECMGELGQQLTKHQDDYLCRLGLALTIWAGLFQ